MALCVPTEGKHTHYLIVHFHNKINKDTKKQLQQHFYNASEQILPVIQKKATRQSNFDFTTIIKKCNLVLL